MSYSSDPRRMGHEQSRDSVDRVRFPGLAGSLLSTWSADTTPARTKARVPVAIPAEQQQSPGQASGRVVSRRTKRRLTWYAVACVALLSIVLGFIFTVPLNTGLHQSSSVQNSGSSLSGGQISSILAQGTQQISGLTTGVSTPIFPGLLYSASSPWNVPIGSHVQIDAASSAMVSLLASGYHTPSIFQYGMPIYVSTASDPLYTVAVNNRAFSSSNPFHIPDTAAPAPGPDRWLFVYDTTKRVIFEMWEARKVGGVWTAQAGYAFTPTGDGVHQVDGAETGGNGASYFGGVIRAADVQRGYINHALSLATSFTANTWRYPMDHSDGHKTGPADLPMGARVQLDPSVNCSTLPNASAGEKMVCQALETYGGYIRDTAGTGVGLTMYFEGEDLSDPARNPPDGSPGDTARSAGVFGKLGIREPREMSAIPWNRLRVLATWNSFTALSGPSSSVTSMPVPPQMTTFLVAAPQIAIDPRNFASLKR